MNELPTIQACTYTSTPLDVFNVLTTDGTAAAFGVRGEQGPRGDPGVDWNEAVARTRRVMMAKGGLANLNLIELPTEETMASQRRLVQVVIVDPDENVPIDQCLLHHGEPKLTDSTDQELFFEIEIKQLLDAHNAKRVKLTNKKIKERVEQLEPAKIRDLRMAVVEIAKF